MAQRLRARIVRGGVADVQSLGSYYHVKTVKSSRQFKGSPISIRAVSRLENRSFPVSLRDILADDEFRLFEGELAAGDVNCEWHMSIWRNGFWSVTGDFHDKGIIAGDFF